MKQIFQSLENGETLISEIPIPSLKNGHLLIKSSCSLISTGTERMLISFGKSNIIDKAKGQPEKVKDVLQKLKSDGPITTYQAVKNKLEQPIPLGYCNVGEIIEIGNGVEGFNIGDRVISNGPHAEIISVPKNLCAVIPDNLNDVEAAFTVPASVGLQGIRLLKPTFGEAFLVIGLGLIGNLTAQLLKSQGCKVIGFDTDKNKCKLARELGIETIPFEGNIDPISHCLKLTKNVGVDGVIIAASTNSDDPITIASKACRKRGRIILVGVTGLNLKRELFYEKEIRFQVSCSYGPGRYDNNYEIKGIDYPIGFVRWTEKRNFEAILYALASKQLNVTKLISEQYEIVNAKLAYKSLINDKKKYAILINYKNEITQKTKKVLLKNELKKQSLSKLCIGVIGSGNYSSRFILPTLHKTKYDLKTLVASSGLRPYFYGKKFKFEYASTDKNDIFNDPTINTLFIATRHDSHAELVVEALKKNKNIFVEKPLCINKQELNKIVKTFDEIKENNHKAKTASPSLMIGFNRRFSPYIKKIKTELNNYDCPKCFIYTCNAGSLSKNHWTKDAKIGGGRLIGEACHFVDLLRFLCGHKIQKLDILTSFKNKLGKDTFSLQLNFYDGSIGTIHYFANGNKSYSKEKLEVFFSGKTILLDNYRKIKSWGLNKSISQYSFSQKKGHEECILNFLNSLKKGQESPIDYNEIFEIHSSILELSL